MDTSPIFNKISENYDSFNHIFSMNIDKSWRKGAARLAFRIAKSMAKARETGISDLKVLDVACGTADLSVLLASKGLSVTGADISDGMLNIGREKIETLWESKYRKYPRPILIKANALKLPFEDNSVDIVTIAYGIRNFEDRQKALNEIMRVLSPGGLLIILEFGKPRNALARTLYAPYFKYVIPGVATALTLGKGHSEYKYFIASVEKFPKFEKFCEELSLAGFLHSEYRSQSGGISVLYRAFKPSG